MFNKIFIAISICYITLNNCGPCLVNFCENNQTYFYRPRSDPDFVSYVEEVYNFIEYIDVIYPAKVIEIQYDTKYKERLSSPYLGKCFVEPYVYIVISKQNWDTLDEWQRRWLIWHELGHCALGLPHNQKDIFHIMYPYLLPSKDIKERWNELVDKFEDFIYEHLED